jgi:hypothetical protein
MAATSGGRSLWWLTLCFFLGVIVWDVFQCCEKECIKRWMWTQLCLGVRFGLEIRIASAKMPENALIFSSSVLVVLLLRRYFQNSVMSQYVSTELDQMTHMKLGFI